jgi:putative peptide zinc metalloprotease protein
MHAALQSPEISSRRPAPFVSRKDLSAQQVVHGGRSYWVVKDPLRNELFRLLPEHYAVQQSLNGKRSLEEIRTLLALSFPERQFSVAELQELVIDLFRKGLLLSTRGGQAKPLAGRLRESRRRRVLSAVQNLLFIQFPGWDPQRLLDAAYPRIRWAFHRQFLFLALLFMLASCFFVLTHFEEFTRRAPEMHEYFRGRSVALIFAVIAVAKTLHELGHALACRHFGAECHEIGVALLIFSPSMYCDVTDAGRLPSRTARLAVGAAGMFVELAFSAAAFWMWWCTRDGWLHDAAWAAMLVTNVSIVLFNLNPLLRLDGYHMLSDWLGIPNLRQKSDQLLERSVGRSLLGLSIPDDPTLPQTRRWFFIAYAAASAIYRWQFVALVSFILYQALKPYGLQSMGLVLGVASVVVAVWRGFRMTMRLWRQHRSDAHRPLRGQLVLAAALAAIVALVTIPCPVVVKAPFIVEPASAQQVYITTPGRLVRVYVLPGQFVRRGDVLVELSNPSLMDQ